MESGKKSKHLLIIIVSFFILLSGGIVLVTQFNHLLSGKIQNLSATLSYLKSETLFARLKVHNIEDGEIHFNIVFFTPDQKEVAPLSLSLSGADLYVESRVIVLSDADRTRALIFPLRIYSDTVAPVDGILLHALYPPNSVPLLYQPNQNKAILSAELLTLSKIALHQSNTIKLKTGILKENFDTSLHIGPFGELQEDSYDLILHPNGAVEIRKQL